MKTRHFFLISLILFQLTAQSVCARTLIGKVVAVTDGDTIKVLVNKKEVKVRLYGIDTPEKKQAFGTQAKKYTSNKCFGKVVTVKEQGKDRYKRTLGYVILPGKKNLNELLVRDGMAWWYQQYAPNNKRLKQLENDARKAKRGLWKDKAPVPPWEFRKRQRNRQSFMPLLNNAPCRDGATTIAVMIAYSA